ncbi:MAG: SDR family NAD(P)-dependent oxidoreductase [Firmicutes bacterium]|nr:SDR family NAD(P)-dependent oxidoreductase [Bacillota bacterium]
MKVLITGAASGLGHAAAALFAKNGDTVYALDISPIAAQERLIPFCADITDENSLRTVFSRLETDGVQLDAIINFAGMIFIDNYLEVAEEKLQRIFDVNLLGAMRVNKIFFPLLRENGKIVITTSEVAPLDPLPFNGIYSTTKTALDCYAQALRQEAGLLGRRVITIRPGAFNTPLAGGSIPSMHAMAQRSRYFSGQGERFETLMRKFTGKLQDPEKLAKTIFRAVHKRHPRNVYTVHSNLGLRLLSLLPKGLQVKVVKLLIGKHTDAVKPL